MAAEMQGDISTAKELNAMQDYADDCLIVVLLAAFLSHAAKSKIHIWVSTMDWDYHQYYVYVSHTCETIDLGDGDEVFQGHDAKNVWMGGTMGESSEERVLGQQMREDYNHEGSDLTWPRYKGIRYFKYPQYLEARGGYGC